MMVGSRTANLYPRVAAVDVRRVSRAPPPGPPAPGREDESGFRGGRAVVVVVRRRRRVLPASCGWQRERVCVCVCVCQGPVLPLGREPLSAETRVLCTRYSVHSTHSPQRTKALAESTIGTIGTTIGEVEGERAPCPWSPGTWSASPCLPPLALPTRVPMPSEEEEPREQPGQHPDGQGLAGLGHSRALVGWAPEAVPWP